MRGMATGTLALGPVLALVLALAAAPAVCSAQGGKTEGPWKVEVSALGATVTNGTNIAFRAKDEEAAQQMANELNKVAKKQERKDKRDNKKK